MSEEITFMTPQAVTGELDISSATLRRWADEFSDYLSDAATSADGRSHRRYSEKDVETLQAIKALMNSGLTYEQARQELAQFSSPEDQPPTLSGEYDIRSSDHDVFEQRIDLGDDGEDREAAEDMALVAANGSESAAVTFLTNTLTTLSDTQKSILNSQAANRELIGVLIQDNLNLKEENSRLRERILEVERTNAQSRQEEEWRREALRQELEAKMMSIQQMAHDALTTASNVEAPEIKAVKNKPGCLGALFGGGDTQIISVPQRGRKGQSQQRRSGAPRAASSSYPEPPQGPQSASHPRPNSLPE